MIRPALAPQSAATEDRPATAPAPAPWLSVLLPVYEVGPWLDECVASILDQQVEGIELVFVDDASPGDDARRLADWQARRPDAIRVLTHARNRGVSAARNTLLAHARGDWLWFIDPDDRMEPGALRSLRGALDAHAPDLVLCDFRVLRADRPASARDAHVPTFDGPPRGHSRDRAALVGGLLRTGQLHPWTKIVRRAAWPAALRFPEGRVFEDLAVFPRLALAVETFLHVPEVWIAYRQRAGSILATLSQQKLDDWTLALVDYPADVRAAGVTLGAGTRFELAHFSARTFLRAVRRERALGTPRAERRGRLANYLARWRASSPLDARELAREYLRRGRLGRWAQFLWTIALIGG